MSWDNPLKDFQRKYVNVIKGEFRSKNLQFFTEFLDKKSDPDPGQQITDPIRFGSTTLKYNMFKNKHQSQKIRFINRTKNRELRFGCVSEVSAKSFFWNLVARKGHFRCTLNVKRNQMSGFRIIV